MKRRREELEPEQKMFSVTGTDVRNYMIRDPLVDWLKLKNRKIGNGKNIFNDFLTERGKEFETKVISYLNKKIPVISVGNTITDETCAKTIKLMKAGVPIIHSAPFRNKEKQIRGIIDLLVRSDYMHMLINENPVPVNLRKKKAPLLSGKYHYLVVDIKFSTLPLRADGLHLLNAGNYPAYKAQLLIYTQGIGAIQGYTSRYAYILGRRWSYTSKGEYFNGLKCFDKVGIIDYEGVDNEYEEKTTNAIKWLKDLRENGKTWTISPPSRVELYPNMCIDSGEWNTEKKKIADQLGDITQLWFCGIKQRQNALNKGIKSWRDKRCSSKNIGINGTRAPIIDKIININRQNKDKIRPKKIKTNINGWKNHVNEVFVDFETFCDIFSDFEGLPEQPKTDTIFMIGVYYFDKKWKYKNFVVKDISYEEEYRIMDEFVKFIRSQNEPKIWYWHADLAMWRRSENRQMDIAFDSQNYEKSDNIVDNWKLYDWYDLCQVFRQEPIVIKDCFKFGLKEIASAMHKHGLIKTKMESKCSSGIDASVKAWKVYESNVRPERSSVIKDISRYNFFDVAVLQEILYYLRENHM